MSRHVDGGSATLNGDKAQHRRGSVEHKTHRHIVDIDDPAARLFPTLLRGTAQGLTFGTSRLVLGIWSFFVPTLAATGVTTVAAFLTVSLAVCAVIGLFLPNTTGKTLGQVEAERAAAHR